MENLVAQYESKQLTCSNNSKAVYQRLLKAGDDAASLINDLNNHKLRIFIAKIKLLINKLKKDNPSSNNSNKGFLKTFKETFSSGNTLVKEHKKEIVKTKEKNYTIALLLTCIPYTGAFGIHDFYLGNYGRGLIKLCTSNFFGIGWFYDIYRMIKKTYTYSNGRILK